MEIYELKKAIVDITEKFSQLEEKIETSKMEKELKRLEDLTLETDFWNDNNFVKVTLRKKQTLEKSLKAIHSLKEKVQEIELFFEFEKDGEVTLEEINDEFKTLNKEFKEFEIMTLLSEEYDDNSALIEIHPGAGGTESQDWANILYDMYLKFLKKNDYKVTVIDHQNAEVAGLKSVLIEVDGYKAYGRLKGENGIHRLVRISPFDSSAKRHTSFASVKVMPYIEQDGYIEIDETEIKIDVYRSGGAGGQSVNTTDSAVRITHIPTNTIVTCQNERSQIQNREQAMKVLKSKLIELKIQEQEEEKAKIAGVQLSNGWGSQKRSYVLHPYKMVKDHHSGFESSQAEKVLSGDLDEFLYYNLLK